MREAERVSYFVRGHVLEQAAGECVGERELLRTLVEMAGLREVPRAPEVHDVEIRLHVGVDDFTSTRILEARTDGVFGG